jgi:CspA family cold shock protein
MTIGTVRWFDVPKGYGLIKPDDGGVDVLVSICALERAGMASLDQGQRLGFEVVRDERIGRSRAVNLTASGLQARQRAARRPTITSPSAPNLSWTPDLGPLAKV